jgi:alpha/beta superfamily hydrolase
MFPCNTSTNIPGPVGPLEAITTCPSSPRRGTVIICHPHPQHGGTMHNKVVHMLARSFGEMSLRTVRFNFRGVGESRGEFGHGIGETEDVLAVLEWTRALRPDDQLWLSGFSFGAFMALRAAARFAVAQLILVAPPVQHYPELGAPPTPNVPMVVLQGDQDDVVSSVAVTEWTRTSSPQTVLKVFPDTGHFFHGRLNDLRSMVQEVLGPLVPSN